MKDAELRTVWRDAGGDFHGPKVETGTMPEEMLLPLLRELLADRARLEWMARCRAGFEFNLFEGTFAVRYRDCYRARDRVSADFKDWRDAIDEAMRNE